MNLNFCFFYYKKNIYIPKVNLNFEIKFLKISNHTIAPETNAVYLENCLIGIIKKIFYKNNQISLKVSIKKIKLDNLKLCYKIKKKNEIKFLDIDFSKIKIIFYILNNLLFDKFYCNKI
jgi:hypothetical protein